MYLALDLNTKEDVVVKVNAESEMNNNEFDIMKELSDNNLSGFPKVFSSGYVQDQPYIV